MAADGRRPLNFMETLQLNGVDPSQLMLNRANLEVHSTSGQSINRLGEQASWELYFAQNVSFDPAAVSDENISTPNGTTISSTGTGMSSTGSIDDHLYTLPAHVRGRNTLLDSYSPPSPFGSALDVNGCTFGMEVTVRAQPAPFDGDQQLLRKKADGPVVAKEKRVVCYWQGCTKDFKTKKYLDRHIKTTHGPCQIHHCNHCPSHFSRTDSRKRHQDECVKKLEKKGIFVSRQGQKRARDEVSPAPMDRHHSSFRAPDQSAGFGPINGLLTVNYVVPNDNGLYDQQQGPPPAYDEYAAWGNYQDGSCDPRGPCGPHGSFYSR